MFKTLDTIANTLSPHKDALGLVAGFMTVLQYMSGSLVCCEIIKKKTTENISAVPFIGGLVISILSLQYGWILRDSTTVYISLAGILFNMLYLMVYVSFLDPGHQRKDTTKIANYAVGITAVCLGYSWFEDPTVVEFRYGMIITCLGLILMASPLFHLGEIIRTKNSSALPFPLIAMGTIVSFLWLVYGLAARNNFLIAQNIAGFLICLLQLPLLVIYPSNHKARKEKNF